VKASEVDFLEENIKEPRCHCQALDSIEKVYYHSLPSSVFAAPYRKKLSQSNFSSVHLSIERKPVSGEIGSSSRPPRPCRSLARWSSLRARVIKLVWSSYHRSRQFLVLWKGQSRTVYTCRQFQSITAPKGR
jgi:hypothetical protein